MNTLVLASDNPSKLMELRALLTPLDWRVIPQKQLNIPAADEPHKTFLENALAKARWASHHADLPALADDSGLCVDALQGAPGVRSARYAGNSATDTDNNARLLQEMKGHENRRAHYYCVLVMCDRDNDPSPLLAEGMWAGEILHHAKGSGGFGYDPLFWLPHLAKSAAELSVEEKNKISHRGLAMAILQHKLKSAWR